ncbi:MAG: hypothetical protein HKN28_12850 [Alphaproteobacteria bacterium]|nr:hypothetical protein [Alphaproteobacteria bacterium]
MRNPMISHGGEDGAMTEVALALAMGFFSIMVLTLVSMGGGSGEAKTYEAIRLVQTTQDRPASVLPTGDDQIVIFDGERFFDTDLNPIDPATVSDAGERRIVLAIDPSVRLAQVMAARDRISAVNLVIANLDDRWRTAIEAAKAAGK